MLETFQNVTLSGHVANKRIILSRNYATLYLKIYCRNFFETWILSGCYEKSKMQYFEKNIFQKILQWGKWAIQAQFGTKIKQISVSVSALRIFFEFLYHEIEQRVDKNVTTEISKNVFHLGQVRHLGRFWPNIMQL